MRKVGCTKGKWSLENYLEIITSKAIDEPSPRRPSLLVKKISLTKIIPLIPLTIGVQGYMKFALLEGSFQRGFIVLLFWLLISLLTYLLSTKIEGRIKVSEGKSNLTLSSMYVPRCFQRWVKLQSSS